MKVNDTSSVHAIQLSMTDLLSILNCSYMLRHSLHVYRHASLPNTAQNSTST